jgi:hypothetical protein
MKTKWFCKSCNKGVEVYVHNGVLRCGSCRVHKPKKGGRS